MFKKLFSRKKSLPERCKEYLEVGPPSHMEDYVPESMTEVVIAHGAQKLELDPELSEMAGIILLESGDLHSIEDENIRPYMLSGAELVNEVLSR